MTQRVGIFFGGPSREREVSFASGRTVYDLLDRSLFRPIPLFVTGHKELVILHWQHLYKGTLRDFYPPPTQARKHSTFALYDDSFPDIDPKERQSWLESIGEPLPFASLKERIDLAFLCLHGTQGEDGTIQGLLSWLDIPYTGAGIMPSAIGISKRFQQDFFKTLGFDTPKSLFLSKQDWEKEPKACLKRVQHENLMPCVVKPSQEGSSIGVSFVEQQKDLVPAINKGFFFHSLTPDTWHGLSGPQRSQFLQALSDLRHHIGYPLSVGEYTFYRPEQLKKYLNSSDKASKKAWLLKGAHTDPYVIVETPASGLEFSCIVIEHEDTGKPLALPPTQILKPSKTYDFQAKYLPGVSRKITPMPLPPKALKSVQQACETLYSAMGAQVYARMDGFYDPETQTCCLNDPNTTSGMLPSSLFFQQAAEIGLNPSTFLTRIIRSSLRHRLFARKLPSHDAHQRRVSKTIPAKTTAQKQRGSHPDGRTVF